MFYLKYCSSCKQYTGHQTDQRCPLCRGRFQS